MRKPKDYGTSRIVHTGSVVEPRMPKHVDLKLHRKPRSKKHVAISYEYHHQTSGRLTGAGDYLRVR